MRDRAYAASSGFQSASVWNVSLIYSLLFFRMEPAVTCRSSKRFLTDPLSSVTGPVQSSLNPDIPRTEGLPLLKTSWREGCEAR